MNIISKSFWYDVEKDNYLSYIGYSDTDSLYCFFPIVANLPISTPSRAKQNMTLQEKWEYLMTHAKGINDKIAEYLNTHYLPKSNINPKYNRTSFKSELLMDRLMFLNVKKNYAYRLLVKEGEILEKPKIKYTGIQVVKSDASKFTQNLLKEMIENIIFDDDIPMEDKYNCLVKTVKNSREFFENEINNYKFDIIGIPAKWSKKDNFIKGMKAYNSLIQPNTFTFGSAGLFIYCKFPMSVIKNQLNGDNKVRGICVPYVYDRKLVKEKFMEYKITVDKESQWNTIFSTTCRRVLEDLKEDLTCGAENEKVGNKRSNICVRS